MDPVNGRGPLPKAVGGMEREARKSHGYTPLTAVQEQVLRLDLFLQLLADAFHTLD